MKTIQFSKKEKEIVHKVHLLTGRPHSEVRDFFESFLVTFLVDYLEKDSTSIPFFGDIKLQYLGDVNTPGGRVAKVDIDFTPTDFLVRTVGQIEDGEESDLEKHLKDKIQQVIRDQLRG